eukprot:g17562.t1
MLYTIAEYKFQCLVCSKKFIKQSAFAIHSEACTPYKVDIDDVTVLNIYRPEDEKLDFADDESEASEFNEEDESE